MRLVLLQQRTLRRSDVGKMQEDRDIGARLPEEKGGASWRARRETQRITAKSFSFGLLVVIYSVIDSSIRW